MDDVRNTEPAKPKRPAVRLRRNLTRAAVVGAILAGTLTVAGPAWAGPMMGC
jgi:hypothetical protein